MRIFMFPGQSSVYPQMLRRALALGPAARQLAERASTLLGWDVVTRFGATDGFVPQCNREVQLSVFLVTQMHLATLAEHGITAECSLGLSLGEYSHLVHIGALTFEDALRIVDARGTLYDASPEGMMVSVFPLPLEELEQVVAQALAQGVIVVSNYNSPTQHVLAGETKAVRWAAQQLEDELGVYAVTIEEHVPMHSPLLEHTAQLFQPYLERARWHRPNIPYLPNVLGQLLEAPTPRDFIRHLAAHVHRPVFWRKSIELLAQIHNQATFLEVGPGEVLYNMLGRRWLNVARARSDSPEQDSVQHFQSMLEQLHVER